MLQNFYSLTCFLSLLPGSPIIQFDGANFQLFPINKSKCPKIDPTRDIKFRLFTQSNLLDPDLLKVKDDVLLENSHINFSNPVVIYFPPFFEGHPADISINYVKEAYLYSRRAYNAILIDNLRLSAGPWYITAVENAPFVGKYAAQFIDYLVSKGLPLNSIHLVGSSLGAQTAGIAGSNVHSGKIKRITGLDPAGPLFTKLPNSLKLDKSDAEFVDIIHTDSESFGYPFSMGHVDFWPNAGKAVQPGCKFSEIRKYNPDGIIGLVFCSHFRSFQFFAESVINENSFPSVSCKTWTDFQIGNCNFNENQVNMGFGVQSTARGNYYLRTKSKAPYSLERINSTLNTEGHT